MSKTVIPGRDTYAVRARGKTGLDVAIPITWARIHGLNPKGKIRWETNARDPDILIMRIMREEDSE